MSADTVLGRPASHRVSRRTAAKRALDVVIAALLLLTLSPVLAIVWLLVRTSTPGGALFRQPRVGRYGRRFVMYKFRTMYADCPDDLHRAYVSRLLSETDPSAGGEQGIFKLRDDPRITRAGRWLRRTSLDELPQLLNVLRGDMSLVGPRPALPWEAALFGQQYHKRFMVPPGVTGLWQVSGRNHLTMRQGLDLDVAYVDQQSLILDLKILIKTLPAVLTGSGAL